MRRNCFTLIELLIVVAIIGILTSLLLPSLSHARKKTMIALCLNNQKQISVAINSYLNDNEYVFPRSYNWPAGETAISWDDRLNVYDGRDLTENQLSAGSPGSNYPLYLCPENKKIQDRPLRSYSINEGKEAQDNQRLGVIGSASGWAMNVARIPRPSEGIVLFEWQVLGNNLGSKNNAVKRARDISNMTDNTSSFWTHKFGSMNFLFADYSARYLTFQSTYRGLRSAWGSSNEAGTLFDCRLE